MGAILYLAKVAAREVISGLNLIEYAGWRIDNQREERVADTTENNQR